MKVWPFLLLDVCTDSVFIVITIEIKAREESHERTMSYLKRFLDEGSPVAETPTVVQNTQIMTMEYGRLPDLYANFEKSYERARTPEAITAMEEWYTSESFLLPAIGQYSSYET
jgi:hypothetical protein